MKVLAKRWTRSGRTVGEGGQGQVLVVSDSQGSFAGEYALKILKNRERVARLDLEISTTKSLWRTGAAVIPILDDYTQSEPLADRPWYVMPLATDGSLASKIKTGEPFGGTEHSALQTFAEIVKAVRTVHDNGVAHRDLKPANVLLHEGRLLLCDLGLCLPLSGEVDAERKTGELERIGSLHYTPKEAFGSRPIDRSQLAFDGYALGKILYELLAGKVLPGFNSPNDPKYDLYLIRGLPMYAGINAVLRGLLADDPDRRLQVLSALPIQVEGLLQWANTVELDEGRETDPLRDQLADTSEAVARALVVVPEEQPNKFAKDTKALTQEIMKALETSKVIANMKDILVGQQGENLELKFVNESRQLRELVSGPFVRTHYGLERLEDSGYPTRSAGESGCAVGIVPKGRGARLFPQIWAGCLVSMKAEKLYIAFGIAKRGAGINAFSDFLEDSTKVFSGSLDDAIMVKQTLEYVSLMLTKFGNAVATEFHNASNRK